MSTTLDRAAFSAYRTQLANRTTLSPEAERDLAIRWRAGDRPAGRRLVEACLPFVMTIALEYRRWGLPLEEESLAGWRTQFLILCRGARARGVPATCALDNLHRRG